MKAPSHYLIPDLICPEVTRIPFSDFLEQGVKVIAFDIDNTLVSYDTPEPDAALIGFLKGLEQSGAKIALVSNNTPQRVERFNRDLGFFTVPDAHKPLKRALAPVFAHFSASPKELLLVGDQLLTDVLTARLHGASAVTVPPIKKVENNFFRFKRMLEKPFIRAYYRRKEKKR